MNRVHLSFMAVFIAFAPSLFAVQPDGASDTGRQTFPVVQQISRDVRLVKLSPDVSVEQLRGEAALAHLRKLISRRPEAFEKSRARLLSRGFAPTQEVFVERTLRTVKGKQHGTAPYQLTQTSSEQSAEGEIVFWSYDGPDYTWQGTIYVEVYADGGASTWDGQIDTGTEDYPWRWYERTWSIDRDRDHREVNLGGEPPRPGVVLAVHREGAGASGVQPVADWYSWATCWRQNVVAGCGAAAIGCLRVKAAWPACWAM